MLNKSKLLFGQTMSQVRKTVQKKTKVLGNQRAHEIVSVHQAFDEEEIEQQAEKRIEQPIVFSSNQSIEKRKNLDSKSFLKEFDRRVIKVFEEHERILAGLSAHTEPSLDEASVMKSNSIALANKQAQ